MPKSEANIILRTRGGLGEDGLVPDEAVLWCLKESEGPIFLYDEIQANVMERREKTVEKRGKKAKNGVFCTSIY